MNEWKFGLSLLLLIAIVIPPQKNMGARGFMNDWDGYIEKPAKRLYPPKLIQVRYELRNTPINIITYLTFLVDYVDWLMCIVLLPCVLMFQDRSLDIVFLIFGLLYIVINFPIGIMRTICCLKISKKQNIKLYTEEYVAMRTVAESLVTKRKAMRKYKEYTDIIAPFLKDFERCLKTKKGKRYIPEDGLKWVADKILPKYKEHLTYSVLSKDCKNKILTICLIKSSKVIVQIPVKKD